MSPVKIVFFDSSFLPATAERQINLMFLVTLWSIWSLALLEPNRDFVVKKSLIVNKKGDVCQVLT
jgi:hypothetical protein